MLPKLHLRNVMKFIKLYERGLKLDNTLDTLVYNKNLHFYLKMLLYEKMNNIYSDEDALKFP